MCAYLLIIVLHCSCILLWFFFFKQKTAYEMRISDWSSDVCSSDLVARPEPHEAIALADRVGADMHPVGKRLLGLGRILDAPAIEGEAHAVISAFDAGAAQDTHRQWCEAVRTTVLEQRWHALLAPDDDRSEAHTAELQALMRISYAVF